MDKNEALERKEWLVKKDGVQYLASLKENGDVIIRGQGDFYQKIGNVWDDGELDE